MHLTLSSEEFRRLLTLATLGEAVLNDWTSPDKLTERQQQSCDLLGDLLERAEMERGLDAVQEVDGGLVLSGELEADIREALTTYDNEVFWDELVHRLSHRDLAEEYGREAADAMPDGYYREAQKPLAEHYWREMYGHGIERLRIQEEPKKAQRKERRKRIRPTERKRAASEEE